MTTTVSFDPATLADPALTAGDLLTIWGQHCPADYTPVFWCPGCDHPGRNLCPTAIAVRTRLRALLDAPDGADLRRTALFSLSFRQFTDLITTPAADYLRGAA